LIDRYTQFVAKCDDNVVTYNRLDTIPEHMTHGRTDGRTDGENIPYHYHWIRAIKRIVQSLALTAGPDSLGS